MDMIDPSDPDRTELRLLALLHDSFKATVDPDAPWSPANDHAVAARRFAEQYISDERILSILEVHDAPYWLWKVRGTDNALRSVVCGTGAARLMVRFVELDASSEGKDVTLLWWFHRTLAAYGLLPASAAAIPVPRPRAANRTSVYLKTFAVRPELQLEVARAAEDLVARHARELDAAGEVLVSDDGLRVLLIWRWSGSTPARLVRDGEVVREAIARHPVFAKAEAVDARVLHASACAPRRLAQWDAG
jgi:hypothetical protein